MQLVVFRSKINFYKSDADIDQGSQICEWDLNKYYGFELELTDFAVSKNYLLLVLGRQIHAFQFSNG